MHVFQVLQLHPGLPSLLQQYIYFDCYMVVIQGNSAIQNTSYERGSRTSYTEQSYVLLWLSFEYIIHWLENWEKCTMER